MSNVNISGLQGDGQGHKVPLMNSNNQTPDNDLEDNSTQTSQFTSVKWIHIKNLFAQFFTLLAILAVLALLAATAYVSVLAIPSIAAGLTLATLGLFPHGIIMLVAVLPVVVTALVLLRFMQILMQMHLEAKRGHKSILALGPVVFLGQLLQRMFIIKINPDERPIVLENVESSKTDSVEQSTGKSRQHSYHFWQKLHILAALAALGIGIYLSVYMVPFLMAAVATLGVPYAVTVMFGVVAAATLVVLSYQLLASLATLREILIHRHFLRNLDSQGNPLAAYNPRMVFVVALATVGLVVGVGISYVIFPVLVHALTPVLAPGMATFTAVAVSLGLTLVMMHVGKNAAMAGIVLRARSQGELPKGMTGLELMESVILVVTVELVPAKPMEPKAERTCPVFSGNLFRGKTEEEVAEHKATKKLDADHGLENTSIPEAAVVPQVGFFEKLSKWWHNPSEKPGMPIQQQHSHSDELEAEVIGTGNTNAS